MKHTSYTFRQIAKMPFILKELLYQSILYDYELTYGKPESDYDFDLDNLSEEAEKELIGQFDNE